MASSVAIRKKAIAGSARGAVRLVLLDIGTVPNSACPDIDIGVGPCIGPELETPYLSILM